MKTRSASLALQTATTKGLREVPPAMDKVSEWSLPCLTVLAKSAATLGIQKLMKKKKLGLAIRPCKKMLLVIIWCIKINALRHLPLFTSNATFGFCFVLFLLTWTRKPRCTPCTKLWVPNRARSLGVLQIMPLIVKRIKQMQNYICIYLLCCIIFHFFNIGERCDFWCPQTNPVDT